MSNTSDTKSAEKKVNQVDFTKGAMLKPILRFSLPVMLGELFSALYNVVDSVIVGQFVGSSALAAVNASFVIIAVYRAIYAGFGESAPVLVGQLFGARQTDKLTSAVATSLVGTIVVGVAMTVIGILISAPLLQLINTPEDILADAVIYLRIFMCGCTTEIFYYMGSMMLRGLGDSRSPMYYMIFCALLNIGLDLLFVIMFDMGCPGVALATIISQAVSAILVIRKLIVGDYDIHLTRQNFRADRQYMKIIVRIAVPSSIHRMANSIGLLFIQSFANSFGTNFVAVNGIVQKMETFIMLPAHAVGQTISIFTAQNLGAGKKERATRGNRISLATTFIMSLAIGVFIFTCAPLIIRLFVNSSDAGFSDILSMGTVSLQILAFFYCLYSLQFGYYSVMRGAGATKPAMIIAIACTLFRIPLTYFMAVGTGHYQNLYWATNIFNTVFMVALFLYYKFGNWEKFVPVKSADP